MRQLSGPLAEVTRPPETTTGRTGQRLVWLDTARGLAIVMVVLYHSVLASETMGLGSANWDRAVGALATFRMPLFFFVSGVLAAGVLRRSWRDITVGRIAVYLWVYALWWTVTFAVEAALPHHDASAPATDPVIWLRGFVVPDNEIWYLWALALFVLLARVTRRAATWLVLGAATALAVPFGAHLLTTGTFVGDYLAMYAVFFLAGARMSAIVLTRTRHRRPRSAVAFSSAALYLALLVASIQAEALRIPFARPALSVIGVAVGVVVALWVSRQRWLGYVAEVGRNTLPVYVMHQLLLACAVVVLSPLSGLRWDLLAVAMPLVLTVLLMPLTLWLHRVLAGVPGLFQAPEWLGTAVGQLFDSSAAARPPGR